MNRTLVDKAKCLSVNANLPKMYWVEVILTAAYLINRSPTLFHLFLKPQKKCGLRINQI